MAREMKDSGIEWIGEIPKEWELPKVKYLFSIGRGRVISQLELEEYGYPVYSSQTKNNGCLGYISTYDFDRSQLTWTTDGANAGTVFLREGKHNCTNVCGTLMPKNDDNNLLFLKYALEYIAVYHKRADINGYKIMNNEMADIVIVLPPLPEQEKIAEFLDRKCAEIDSVIADTQRTIEEYKKLKQSVITQAVTKGIRGERPMKDSGIEWIGEIACDFEIKKLKYLCYILDQFRSPITADKRNQDAEVLYDYYGASGAIDKIDGYTIDDHVMLIGEDGANLRMRNLPLMYEVNGKAWINNHAHILKPKDDVDFYFLFYALECLDLNTYITGSAQPKLSQDNLRNIWIPVPSYEEQVEISRYIKGKCSALDQLIASKQQLLTELETYKKAVIYEYVTGKKEVPACQ